MTLRRRRSTFRRYTSIFTVVFALIGFFISSFLRKPKVGFPINNGRYNVDLESFETIINTKSKDGSHKTVVNQLLSTFIQSSYDDSLSQFLQKSEAKGSTKIGILQIYIKETLFWLLQMLLGWARPDASGFVNKASLYVGSRQQIWAVLKPAHNRKPPQKMIKPQNLLDLGSGSGTETVKLQSVLGIKPKDVTCIEDSFAMRNKLQLYGFQTKKSHNELSDTEKFTHVSLLNILDRCDMPHEILSAAIHKLETDGIIMLAIVLPFKAKVYIQKRFIKWGKPASRKPYKPLKLQPKPSYIKGQNSNTFEIALIRFVETILLHHPNLELKSWTRMPYVSSGDTHFTHYTIDMAFMVFSLS